MTSRERSSASRGPSPHSIAARVAFACTRALVAPLVLAACTRAHTTARAIAHAHDAAADSPVASAPRDDDAAEGPLVGPPNPWGDRTLPDSTAVGPEVAATRATLDALRASIGFWRVHRRDPSACPTLSDLADAPAASFDRSTMARDSWGTPFVIECQGARVRLRSLGPDRTADTPDDVWAQ